MELLLLHRLAALLHRSPQPMGKGGRAHKAAVSAFTHWSGERCESEKAGRRLVVDLAVTLLILSHKVVAKDDEGGGISL